MSFSFNFFGDTAPAPGAVTTEATLPPASAAQSSEPQVIPVSWVEFERLPSTSASKPSHEYAHGVLRAVVDADAVSGCKGLDVVPSQYEGGAKTWECTLDVMDFLSASSPASAFSLPSASRVMDLGCGAALLASYALKKWAPSRVVCQDLNASVLRDVSSVNLLLNLATTPTTATTTTTGEPTIELVAGSWTALAAELRKAKAAASSAGAAAPSGDLGRAQSLLRSFDVVLASEVLYREHHYDDLVSIMGDCLAVPSGVAIIGSKRNYFGAELGGSVPAFVEFVKRRAFEATAPSPGAGAGASSGGSRHVLTARVVRSFEDGKSMTRDIVLLQWQPVPPA